MAGHCFFVLMRNMYAGRFLRTNNPSIGENNECHIKAEYLEVVAIRR